MQFDTRAFQWRENRLIMWGHFPRFIAPGFQTIKTEYEYFIFCTFFMPSFIGSFLFFLWQIHENALKHDDKSVLFFFF